MKKKILLIDDEKNLIQMLKVRLELSWDYAVTTATSGKEGLEKFKCDKYDLVIVDYEMPDMNGEEVLNAIKKMKSCVPVFIFSIYYDDSSKVSKELQKSADAIVGKPINFDKLHDAIEKAVSSHEAQD